MKLRKVYVFDYYAGSFERPHGVWVADTELSSKVLIKHPSMDIRNLIAIVVR